MSITPAILAHSAEDAKAKLFEKSLQDVAPRFHIDVLDGTMFGASCWADPKIIGTWENLPEIEIHLMVNNPLPLTVEWKRFVPTLKNVIIHAEVPRPKAKICERIKLMQLDVSVALNPETSLDELKKCHGHLDEVVIMGVHPGASGQKFLGEPILSKIRRLRILHPELSVAIDGGVNTETVRSLKDAGAQRFIASSAIWHETIPRHGFLELRERAIITT
jgi:ribulose-phosphate 3-epimerase